jgi:hypothetical protein
VDSARLGRRAGDAEEGDRPGRRAARAVACARGRVPPRQPHQRHEQARQGREHFEVAGFASPAQADVEGSLQVKDLDKAEPFDPTWKASDARRRAVRASCGCSRPTTSRRRRPCSSGCSTTAHGRTCILSRRVYPTKVTRHASTCGTTASPTSRSPT